MSFDRSHSMPAGTPAPSASEKAALTGRTVLVTGGAHRVGGSISRHLGELGARVVVTYHANGAAAEELVAGLPAGGLALASDLTEPDAPSDLLARANEAGFLPDVVVHAAASFLHKPIHETSADDWDRVFALNTRAFFLLAREFAKRHGVVGGEGPRGSGGPAGGGGGALDLSLVAISDSGALELWPGYAAHCVSKAALEPLVQVLAKALAPGVRVNAVLPGPVLPPEDADEAARRDMAERTLVKRLGHPDDIARAVAFLLENRFITASCLPVTGGSHLWRGVLDRTS